MLVVIVTHIPLAGIGGGLLSSMVWLPPFIISSLPSFTISLLCFFLSRGFCTFAYNSSTLFCSGSRPGGKNGKSVGGVYTMELRYSEHLRGISQRKRSFTTIRDHSLLNSTWSLVREAKIAKAFLTYVIHTIKHYHCAPP